MRVITLTRKSLLSIFLCFMIGVFGVVIATNTMTTAVQTVAEDRIIPIYYVDRSDKVCSISFDAAWGNEQTETLLDILDENDVKTTFFLVGSWVDKYPESVKEISKRGHDIGNHSDTHAHMSQISKTEKKNEITKCNEKIEKLTKKKVTLFRPPYGEYDNSVVETAKLCNMFCVQWNIDSLDWKDPTAEDMVKRIESRLCPGSIILLHNGAKNTPEALPLIIKAIKAQGYRIVPISQILLSGSYTTDHEGKMISSATANNAE